MGTLIVDENGKRRGFRVSQGRLTVGSAEGAGLRLEAADVALLHADLDLEAGELFVTPRPGVLPPALQGVAVSGRTRVESGQELRIGRAVLTWREDEEAPAPTPPKTSASTARAPERGAARSPRKRRTVGAAARRDRADAGGRTASRRKEKSGVPGWLVPTGAVLVFAVAGLVIYRSFEGNREDASRSNSAFHLRRAEELVVEKNTVAAREHLAQVDVGTFTVLELRQHEELLAAIDAIEAEWRRAKENEKGDTWFEFKLEEYEKRYLSGEPSAAVVRVFLERCAEFRQSWPTHPELAWVGRQERRFANYPGLDDPEGLEDALWRARVLTHARPRDYAEAFGLLERYRETASAEERAAVDAMLAELETERASYHADQLQQARAEYQRGNTERAIEWLVQSIVGLGDVGMADEAASILVKFPKADAVLRGYASERRETFDELVQNEVIAEFARRTGVE